MNKTAKSKMSYIGKRFASLIFVMILLIILIISFIFYRNKKVLLQKQELLTINNMQELISTTMNHSIKSIREDALMLSEFPPIQGIIRAKKGNGFDKEGNSSLEFWEERLNTIFDRFIDSHEEYLSARYIGIGNNGREIVKVKKVNDQILKFTKDEMQTKSHRPYFKKCIQLKQGEFYLSELNFNREHGEIDSGNIPVIRFAVPIFSPDQKIFGFVIINKKMTGTFQNLKKLIQEKYDFYFTNSVGEILIDPKGVGEFSFEFNKQHSIHSVFPVLGNDPKNPRWTGFTDEGAILLSGKELTVGSEIEPRKFYSFLISNKSALNDKIFSSFLQIGVTALVLLFISIFLSWRLSHSLTKPLNHIAKVMKKYAEEKVLGKLPTDAKGEIGELANAFEFVVGEVNKQNEMMVEAHHLLEEQQMAAEKARFDAEKANKFKSEFLANMSHEIRTPLNAIIGYSDLMMDEELTVAQRNMMQTVTQSSRTLLELINDVLDFSKIEAGEMSLEEIEFDLEDLVFQISEQSRCKVKDKDLQLHIQMDPVKENIIGDPTRLKQILINLVGNAVKFTESGDITTKIEILGESELYYEFKISVMDTGIGIEKNQLENIFNAFKQADGSTTRNYGGTGLGLNISRKLVELMGGSLEVSSEVGKGTSFFFNCQFNKGSAKDNSITIEKDNLSILLIETNKTSQNVFRSYCKKAGIEIFTESSVNEALELIENKKNIDLIITDLSIEQNKILKSELHKIFQSEMIPFLIAAETDISPAKLEMIKQLQFDKYIYKPVRYSIFCETINNLFRGEDKKPDEKPLYSSETERTAKILLVEDNKINQKLATKVLRKMGHDVSLAENGKSAIEKVSSEDFELIFMDVQMPVMDGIEATKELRKLGLTVPIIALTANAFDSDRAACLAAGMNDFASKPLERERIRELINHYTNDDSTLNSA